MEALYLATNWGTPLGLGLFFMLSGIGAAFAFWGLAGLHVAVSAPDRKDARVGADASSLSRSGQS